MLTPFFAAAAEQIRLEPHQITLWPRAMPLPYFPVRGWPCRYAHARGAHQRSNYHCMVVNNLPIQDSNLERSLVAAIGRPLQEQCRRDLIRSDLLMFSQQCGANDSSRLFLEGTLRFLFVLGLS